MIALIEDSNADAALYRATFLSKIPHERFTTMQSFMCNKEKFSHVILDLSLSDSFGVETVSSVRSIFEGEIVVLTGMAAGYLTGKLIKKLMDAGADEVFLKGSMVNEGYPEMIERTLNG